MNSKIAERTRTIKWDFFRSIERDGANSKGDVRSYIALKTWEYEKDEIQCGRSKYEAHMDSLEKAIGDYKESKKQGSFTTDFKRAIENWRLNGGPIEREAGGECIVKPPVKKVKNWKRNELNLISLFSGAFGLDIGFMAAGFSPKVALDLDKASELAITSNLPKLPFISEDIVKVKTNDILEKAGLGVGEVDLVAGGPPCQPFSTAGRRKGLDDPRASPLREFIRFVKEARPRCFVMEEVEGICSARLGDPEGENGNGDEARPIGEKGSAFKVILEMLRSTRYNITYDLLNAADYGAPQFGKRFIFIGMREGRPTFPEPTHSGSPQTTLTGRQLPWNTFWEATIDLQGSKMESSPIGGKRGEQLALVPPGGNWRHLPENEIRNAMAGAYESGGGKMGYFRRLTWDSPSPTVVTSPIQKSTMLCHPEELRGLSVEEYKRLQGFPDDWEIPGNTATKYLLIGNAVPVYLSHAIALQVRNLLEN
jgi:DNA (cytosine-5)-methyltransferase 1